MQKEKLMFFCWKIVFFFTEAGNSQTWPTTGAVFVERKNKTQRIRFLYP